MSDLTLFDVGPYALAVPEPGPKLSAGGRLRVRQLQAIANGVHPLALSLGATMRMHPDADRDAKTTDAKNLPLRCGSCRFRRRVHGGARDFPKCLYGATATHSGPRISHGPATDVRAFWPACAEYEAVADV